MKRQAPEELSGFLNLAISGLNRLLKSKKFSYDMSLEEVREEYHRKSMPVDSIKPFMSDATLSCESNVHVLKDDLWKAYQGWCQENDIRKPLARQTFLSAISKGWHVEESQFPDPKTGIRVRGFRCLGLSQKGLEYLQLIDPTKTLVSNKLMASISGHAECVQFN